MADSANLAPGAPVLFREAAAANGKTIGYAMLNSEKSLNALSLAMIRLLDAQLRTWAIDPAIACVVLHGAGEKAFCAGGDVRSLYDAMRRHPASLPNPDTLPFFAEEYRLDHFIHHYPKPFLVWGSGIVMGGGLGLFAGASHRVVTETSRVAMPEITIGLFPDVGGSWFLPRMPGRTGLFVALTGASLNGHDLLRAKLADHFVRAADRDAIFAALSSAEWTGDAVLDRSLLGVQLEGFSAQAVDALPASKLEEHAALIAAMCASNSLAAVVDAITGYTGEDTWLRRAATALKAGSPTTAALIWALFQRGAELSLAEVFRLELIVALHCCAQPDFAEGVRALLVDKDNAPRWAAVTQVHVDGHFVAPAWPNGVHPLADL
ncbi:MAG: enoyl-CoA hydratase/isomerase family protein [Nevskia sp.]|nr:enoyl-CoA hydratase/isomerase family protein [Nevskia sp.]